MFDRGAVQLADESAGCGHGGFLGEGRVQVGRALAEVVRTVVVGVDAVRDDVEVGEVIRDRGRDVDADGEVALVVVVAVRVGDGEPGHGETTCRRRVTVVVNETTIAP